MERGVSLCADGEQHFVGSSRARGCSGVRGWQWRVAGGDILMGKGYQSGRAKCLSLMMTGKCCDGLTIDMTLKKSKT